jgi:hypothetical protein
VLYKKLTVRISVPVYFEVKKMFSGKSFKITKYTGTGRGLNTFPCFKPISTLKG